MCGGGERGGVIKSTDLAESGGLSSTESLFMLPVDLCGLPLKHKQFTLPHDAGSSEPVFATSSKRRFSGPDPRNVIFVPKSQAPFGKIFSACFARGSFHLPPQMMFYRPRDPLPLCRRVLTAICSVDSR